MLKEILEKMAGNKPLEQEENDFLAKLDVQNKDKPEPQRKLTLVDDGVKTRKISDIMALPATALNSEEKEIQRHMDDAYIVSSVLKKDPRQLKMWNDPFNRSSALKKAMDEATANEGQEFVPTLLSADFINRFRLEAKVAALFNDYPMPSNPWKMPYYAGMNASNFYFVGESTSDSPTGSPPSTPGTDAQTLTAKKFKARVLFSDELNEDSVVAVLPMLRADLIKSGAEAVEDAIINGDVTATHQDSDVTSSQDRRKAWSGLRKLCPVGPKIDLSTFTTMAHYQGLLKLMGKYGMNPKDMAVIVGAVAYNKFRALTAPGMLTLQEYGPQAVLLTGEAGAALGSPIILSEYIRENLNASGVYDGTTTTYTIVLIVNRNGFMLGSRGAAKLSFVADPTVDQNQLIMSFRKAWSPVWTVSTTITTIGVGYKVS